MNETLRWNDGECGTILPVERAEGYLYTNANRMFVVVGIPIVLVLGLLGNIAFLIVICRLKHMRNITNYYLANLSIADSCLLAMSGLQYFWTYEHSPLDVNFVFGTSFGCAVPNFLVYLCYFASVWLVTLVAAERYMAICYPLRHHTITGSSRSVRLLLLTWGVSLLMTGFAAPYGDPEVVCINWPNDGPYSKFPAKIAVCRGLCAWCDKALYAIDSAQFIFAFLINTCMYGRIISILNRRTVSDNDAYGSAPSSSLRVLARNRDQVARMLLINTIVFFVCLMPYCIMNVNSLVREIWGSHGFLSLHQKQILSWISKLTTQINSSANPYLYSATNKRYRQAFLQIFKCFFKDEKDRRRSSSAAYTKASLIDTKL